MTKPPCSITDCPNTQYAKGFCGKHYERQRRHGDPTVVKVGGPPPSSRVTDFLATGTAVCTVHGEHDEWRVQGHKEKRGRGTTYRALDCRRCERERTRRYVAENAPLVRSKQMTVHARAVRAVNTARKRADKMGWLFDLTPKWVEEQHERQGGRCYLTGREFDHSDMRRAPDSLSLDRVDPSLGYTRDNVRLATWQANFAKLDMNLTDFVALCRDVATHA